MELFQQDEDAQDVDSAEQSNSTEVTTAVNSAHDSMETSSRRLSKKEISWNEPNYLDKIKLQVLTTDSQILRLERKASVGPCFRPGMPNRGPSGITICLPRKSNKNLTEDKPMNSGICLSISKKSITSKSKCQDDENNAGKCKEETNDEANASLYSTALRGKFDAMCIKIRNAFNM